VEVHVEPQRVSPEARALVGTSHVAQGANRIARHDDPSRDIEGHETNVEPRVEHHLDCLGVAPPVEFAPPRLRPSHTDGAAHDEDGAKRWSDVVERGEGASKIGQRTEADERRTMVRTHRLGDRLRCVVGLAARGVIGNPVTEALVSVGLARRMRGTSQWGSGTRGDASLEAHAPRDLAGIARRTRNVGVPMAGRDAGELDPGKTRRQREGDGVINPGVAVDQSG
jgi:hypothetical protein